MKICLLCQNTFTKASWECPYCHHTPHTSHGFYSFAPHLSEANDGLNKDAHHLLDKIQDSSFWFRERNALIQKIILRYFKNAHHVMEIGCGSGYVLNGIRKMLPNAILTGTEIYAYSLKYAAKRTRPPCQFLQVDARALPFKQEFDLIGAFDVLEHIEEHEEVIANLHASLKPGGGIILTVPQHKWLWSKVDEIACHKRRYTRKELKTLIEKYNFEILLDTSFMFFLLPLMLIRRYIGNKSEAYDPSSELILPKWIDKSFEYLLKCERGLINIGIRFPLGGSRLVVAKTKDQ